MTTIARRILITTWEGGGTVPPIVGVARALIARGHQVHVLADPTLAVEFHSAGCTFSPWRRAPHRTSLDPEQDLIRDWETAAPLVMLRKIRDAMIAGPAADYAADTAEAIADFRPHVVAPDWILFGAIIGAQGSGVPVAPLVPNIWCLPSKGAPPVGPGLPLAKGPLGRLRDTGVTALVNRLFKAGLPTLNSARAVHGLAPLRSFYDQVLAADRILVLTSAAFDLASDAVPPNVTYTGPVLDEPTWAEPWVNPWATADSRPLVLVGFSSTYQQQGPLLQRVVDALSTLPVRGVVTLGQMLDESEVTSCENVQVVRSAPHRQILAEAALTVTHCGHGTTMKAVAAGVPMVCIPMGRDQNDTAARVVHHGAGMRLSTTASVERIRAAVGKVLAEPQFRDQAASLSVAVNVQDGAARAARELEELAAGASGEAPASSGRGGERRPTPSAP